MAGDLPGMPEGDTIHRTAKTLQRTLAGEVLSRLEGAAPPAGLSPLHAPVEAVTPRGKNVVFRLGGGTALVTHLGMTGSWHVYRAGERWQKPRARASLVLGTDRVVAVGFSLPTVEWCPTRELPLHPRLAALGPDLLDPAFDGEAARRRLRADPARAIGDALLDQRLVAGIGNVYKSETLFVARVDPFAAVGSLDDGALGRILDVARRLMAANLDGYPRTTCPQAGRGGAWVYGRAGRGCRRCGRRVRLRRQGTSGRSTYWCPACQAASQPAPG